MFLHTFTIFIFVYVQMVILTQAIENKAADVCNADQFAHNPCRCCKMDCWYSIAKGATHELGHMPGQAGEQEALATLRLIRACMITECSPICGTPGLMGMMKKTSKISNTFCS
uniref:Uncharacterized protein n=1 Tax=Meloidogyne enterolobii TaxID=390850 RepID=A0A6V7U582_MELEN|nr:unnamed protein product [Meloidogyne enterolobii]